MARKPYTVENQRPRKTVSLFGRVLAPKGHGRNSQCDLDEAQLLMSVCIKLFKTGRIKLARGTAPPALTAALSNEEAVETTPAPSDPPPEETKVLEPPAPKPTPDPEPEPPQEVPVPEPVADSPPADEAKASAGEQVISKENELPALDDLGAIWAEDELFSLNSDAQKIICRSRGLKVGGKEAERVARILAEQEEV